METPQRQHFHRLFTATQSLMPAQAVSAPDDAVLDYFKIQLAIAEELLWKQSTVLHQFLFADDTKNKFIALYADLPGQRKAQEAFSRLIEQAAARPQSAPVAAAAELVLDTISKDIEKTGAIDLRVLDLQDVPPADAVTLCTTTLMLYKRILDLPPVSASHVIRYLVAGK